MNLEKEIKKLLEKYIEKEDNLLLSSRLFVANSVLLWAKENVKDPKAIKYYITEVERHMQGEITLYWQNGIVKVKREPQGQT